MSNSRMDNELSRFVRDNDPLELDPQLSADETKTMRRAVMAEVPTEAPSRWRFLSPAFGLATMLLIALAVTWWPAGVEDPVRPVRPGIESARNGTSHELGGMTSGTGNALESREIQFETPGGTLVVWVLNPKFPS